MKGSVFIALNEMVESEGGLNLWHRLLDETGDKGVFTSTATYDDARLVNLLVAYQGWKGDELKAVLKQFGEFLFAFLHKGHPAFANSQASFRAFIESIDGVIHLEVTKLDPDARPPRILVESMDDGRARIQYHSERKLCFLAEGLLHGAAGFFGTSIKIDHPTCMHHGAPNCVLLVSEDG